MSTVTPRELLQTIRSTRNEIDRLCVDLDLSDIRRETSEDEQGLKIAELLAVMIATNQPIVHNGKIRTVLSEAIASIIDISKERLEAEAEDDREFAEAMKSPAYRRAVSEGRD